ncbi:MAG: FAD-dependent oxidoreductase [Deltaproteobacteria bacterium]|nr:FAD-dependent oxidoreductase [Deltaproteobacteria bacterium]
MEHYDLAVIGGGSAGLTAAFAAGRIGARVVLVDKQRLGGDCTHTGCIPSKALIKAAKVAHTVRTASRFGVKASSAEVDFAGVMAHVKQAIETVEAGETPEILADKGVDVMFGGATFLSPTRLKVGDEEIEADHSIIAVGASAAAPPIPGLEETGYLDNHSLFSIEELPARLAIIGGGPIGVEMGQAFARLGSKVTIIEAGPRILGRDDAELATLLMVRLADELEVMTESRVVGALAREEHKVVRVSRDGAEVEVEADAILVAAGRRPRFDGLGLEAAGVEIGKRGIAIDSTLRTTAKNIWAAGDCVGQMQFTHFAEAQARVAVRNALFTGSSKFDGEVMPWTTFADPELAHVGLTEEQAREAHGDRAQVYRYSYADLDRAITEGEGFGLAKVVCDTKGKILGASMLGPHSGEAISEIVVAMNQGIGLSELAKSVHPYPTMNRIVRRLGDQRFMEQGVGDWTTRLFGRFKGKKKAV